MTIGKVTGKTKKIRERGELRAQKRQAASQHHKLLKNIKNDC